VSQPGPAGLPLLVPPHEEAHGVYGKDHAGMLARKLDALSMDLAITLKRTVAPPCLFSTLTSIIPVASLSLGNPLRRRALLARTKDPRRAWHGQVTAHLEELPGCVRQAAVAEGGMMDRSTQRIRVLVGDDHPVFRRGIRAILGAEPDTELVGEATDGEEAVELALELGPDVILMDLNMPKMTGIEATRRILEVSPDTAILMLTMFEDDKSIFAAMRAGAHGYVLKGADGTETLRAIHAVASGEAIFSPTITRRLTGYFATPGEDLKTSSVQAFPNLSEREHEILSLMAERALQHSHRLSVVPQPQDGA